MAGRLIALMLGLVALFAGSLVSPGALAREMRAGEDVLVDGGQSPAPDLQGDEPYPDPEETASPYPPTSQAIPLISVVLLGALLVIFVVGVCLRYCLRRSR